MRDLVVLTGPTAVGKTDLSLELANQIKGEIISVDSMQIYQEMDIGTAKATAEEQQRVEHHLLDLIKPTEEYSLAQFQNDCDQKIAELQKRDRLPLLVGGTNLYIRAVLAGFMLPEIKPQLALRERLENLADQSGTEAVHDILTEYDPQTAAKLHPNDLRRVIRAIEIYKATGKTKSFYKEQQQARPPRYSAYKFGLVRSREMIYQRINQRVELMLARGLLDEVRNLKNKYDNLSDTARQALGYKELLSYLDGQISKTEAVRLIKKRSRNFAKRQLTWLRREYRQGKIFIFNLEKETRADILQVMTAIIKGDSDYEQEYKKRSEINF
ncbi:tRNA (adenosine(37)-N6)-dimethylallyltransferase MiaA [Halanaerobium salsuginis]|uniref:tRNA dimethylallyltransferase n=1 Tax=Halanaerobium salsuginis TaxID=29563 RepID=A0A1I4F6B9_9FIRM|nr:tRNA (adenosine(37)-N6)-dimethylallyltransferase MiaA [Halanaerobium salsuginis]SFL12336.1 tRNA dimethylallyltransferase [Halanaerobium salsuginis]